MIRATKLILRIFLLCLFVVWGAAGPLSAGECAFDPETSLHISWEAHPTVEGLEFVREGRFSYRLEPQTLNRVNQSKPKETLERSDQIKAEEVVPQRFPSTSQAGSGDGLTVERDRLVCFRAVRFNPRLIRADLIDVVSTINNNPVTKGGVRRTKNAEGVDIIIPVTYSTETLLTILSEKVPFVVNAGWNTGIDVPVPAGFTVIDGRVLESELRNELSAIVCLDPIQRSRPKVPKMFWNAQFGRYSPNNWDATQAGGVRACKNSLQVGPRIIEFDNTDFAKAYSDFRKCIQEIEYISRASKKQIGVCESTLALTKRIRSVFAVDMEEGSALRHLYFLTTTNPVALFDLQMMFLNGEFFKGGEPYFALNLAGHSQAAFFLRIREAEVLSAGNLVRALATAIVLRPR